MLTVSFFLTKVRPKYCMGHTCTQTIFVDLKFKFNWVPCMFICEIRQPDQKVTLRNSGFAPPAAAGQVL